ncbi:hypothetical protein ACHAXM_007429 [Skeletonema potamos]|jgi:hypothetical protein
MHYRNNKLNTTSIMTPKPAWACVDMISTISLREDSTNDEKKEADDCSDVDEKKDSCHDDKTSPRIKKAVDGDEVEQASTSNYRQLHECRLEHSFSYNDLSHFNIDAMRRKQPKLYPEMKGLRADFVHLQGLSSHPKATDSKQNGRQEAFHARPLRRALTMGDSNEEAKDTTKTVVVVPSIDLDKKELTRMCADIEFYEERQLFHLLMAGDPSVRIIYLTSRPVHESVVKYYLSLNHHEDIDAAHYQSNLFCDVHRMLPRVIMIHVPSTKCISLSDKILRQKRLITLLQELIHNPFDRNAFQKDENTAGMCVFTGSNSVDELSHELGVKLLEASGESLHFGTKQGSREIFAACGISHPAGTPSLEDEDLLTYGEASEHGGKVYWAYNHRYIRSSHNLAIGIARKILSGIRPRKWIVKLNQGFSGKGNASIDLQDIQRRFAGCKVGDNEATLRIAEQIETELATTLKCEDPKMTWLDTREQVGFQTQIKRLGVIAEVFIEGEVPTSPSIQAVVEANNVCIISTHEQVLAGQVYQGCINPCNAAYRASMMEAGLKVGKFLAAHGVRGHFSVDFLACKQPKSGSWDVKAVEVNLRQGGTTHPQATMALLCGGSICSDGLFRTNEGELRCYVATDCHYSENLKGCSEKHLIEALECTSSNPAAHKIRWNKADRIGVVFHLFKFISTGRIGFTAIGRSIEESQMLFNDTIKFLDNFHNS